MLHQVVHDDVGAPEPGAVERRLAAVVRRVDVVAELEADPDRLEHLVFLTGERPAILAGIPDREAGRHHQRRGAVGGGNQRVGTRLEQHPHRLDICHLGRQHERRSAQPVEPIARTVPYAVAGHPRIHVDSPGEQLSDQVDAIERAGGERPRGAEPDVHPPRAHGLVQGVPARPCMGGVGAPIEQIRRHLPVGVGGRYDQPMDAFHSSIRAIDPATAEIQWEFPIMPRSSAGITTTAGGLVFTGSADGYFFALNAETGEELWNISLGRRVHSAPITFEAEGKQYVSIASGNVIYAFGLRD